jgi:hypothetical protein
MYTRSSIDNMFTWKGIAICILCLLSSCAPRIQQLPSPEEAIPAVDAIPGWKRATEIEIYDQETLYNFMNGAADLYFTYGFQRLAVGQYTHTGGDSLQVEIYRLATDADGYGLFKYNSYGEPIDLGVDGEIASGHQLAFWQKRSFVQIIAHGTVDDANLHAFGESVAAALPPGGERPVLVNALPKQDMQPGSVRFFREKIALDNFYWLGMDDPLGLNADTEGVLAHYRIGESEADLILIAFPDVAGAQDALSGLKAAGIEGLLSTKVQGHTLGAVFGKVSPESADQWISQALDAVQR